MHHASFNSVVFEQKILRIKLSLYFYEYLDFTFINRFINKEIVFDKYSILNYVLEFQRKWSKEYMIQYTDLII